MSKQKSSTPQELLKLYNIVELRNGYTFKIEEIKNNKVYDRLGDRGFELNDITAIYTPNADKTQYTEQWRRNALDEQFDSPLEQLEDIIGGLHNE